MEIAGDEFWDSDEVAIEVGPFFCLYVVCGGESGG